MSTRIQSLKIGMGIDAEPTYNAGSTNFIRLPKMNMDATSPQAVNESDAAWIGKNSEFANNLYKTAADTQNRVSKYGSAEWLTYMLAFGLGDVTETTGTYTIIPLTPSDSLQLPSFSVVEQLPEGGGNALDNEFLGCVVDNLAINWSYGPGLKSISSEMSYRGSGKLVTPSTIVLPDVTTEHHALGSGMVMNINSVDYVAGAVGLTGSFRWNNNLLVDQGYYIGSGLDSTGFAVRNRLEYGARTAEMEFTVRLLSTSAEYTKLRAVTVGSATLTFAYDSTHTVSIAIPKLAFKTVNVTESDGIAAVNVACELLEGDDPLVTVTAKCGVSGIAQIDS